MQGGDLLIECLKAQGVRAIFGMPGTQNIGIYDALRRRGAGAIAHYLVRHEFSATIMADGYSRATGEVGVALTVPGPGASNAATGLLEAYTDCVPVLLITGQSHSDLYRRDPSKLFHGLDQMSFFRPVTKYRAIAHSVEDIPRVVEEAFQAMRTGRPGPAMLEFPSDVIGGSGAAQVPPQVPLDRGPAPDSAALRNAAAAIDRAQRPFLVAGAAVLHAGACGEVRALAERLRAPVAVTRLAKGVLPDDHDLAVHGLSGYMARQVLGAADCTVALGVRFTSLDTGNWRLRPPRPLIQLDPDPAEIGREYACDVGVSGDLRLGIERLATRVRPGAGQWEEVLGGLREAVAAQPPLPLLPEIRAVLPPEGILAADVHALGYATFNEFPVTEPRRFLYPCIGIALGHAFPSSLGAKVACPDRPVVCFAGDGGYLMGSCELSTAVKYGIKVVSVVVNEGELLSIRGSQEKAFGGRTIGTRLVNPGFSALARAYGADAVRITDLDRFGPALEAALSAAGPSLIEVMFQDRKEELIRSIGWLHGERLRRKP